jgi:hypothetical protein
MSNRTSDARPKTRLTRARELSRDVEVEVAVMRVVPLRSLWFFAAFYQTLAISSVTKHRVAVPGNKADEGGSFLRIPRLPKS